MVFNHSSVRIKSGGQYAPKQGGQFGAKQGGHFKMKRGGQLVRNIHYVNDYDGTGTFLPLTSVKYTFDHDATRVITPNTHYRIPLVLEHGVVLFRVRGVGIGGANFDKKLEGSWSSEGVSILQTGIVNDYPSNIRYSFA